MVKPGFVEDLDLELEIATKTELDAGRLAGELAAAYEGLDGQALLEPMIRRIFPGRIAVVSSFGTEAAVLLALVAEINPAVPVIFLDTGKHFEETLDYRDELVAELGLEDVRTVTPDWSALLAQDPDGTLWRNSSNACCHLRKVLPLRRALEGFDAWITGRKRYQGQVRWDLPAIEATDGRVKINPLVGWSLDRVEAAFEARGLPQHPLLADGYLSVGCEPCTRPTAPGTDLRSGRWAGLAKSECGIHLAPLGGCC
jgi:phosphoadenosine phosphosulfate reductase